MTDPLEEERVRGRRGDLRSDLIRSETEEGEEEEEEEEEEIGKQLLFF
jgi:hypothetical protein